MGGALCPASFHSGVGMTGLDEFAMTTVALIYAVGSLVWIKRGYLKAGAFFGVVALAFALAVVL